MPSSEPTQAILLVEDDPALAMGLVDTLEFEGFRVRHTKSGEEGIEMALNEQPDCMILDLMLPDINGYQVCEQLREAGNPVPIIMLTARTQEADRIRGLNVGADDYVAKPFSVGELVARVRAILRRTGRSANSTHNTFRIGDAIIDPRSHSLTREGETVALSFYEVQLLQLLWERRGEPVSREDILEKVWAMKSVSPTNRTVDNFVVRLRKKLEPDHTNPRHILTVYGLGYKLVE